MSSPLPLFSACLSSCRLPSSVLRELTLILSLWRASLLVAVCQEKRSCFLVMWFATIEKVGHILRYILVQGGCQFAFFRLPSWWDQVAPVQVELLAFQLTLVLNLKVKRSNWRGLLETANRCQQSNAYEFGIVVEVRFPILDVGFINSSVVLDSLKFVPVSFPGMLKRWGNFTFIIWSYRVESNLISFENSVLVYKVMSFTAVDNLPGPMTSLVMGCYKRSFNWYLGGCIIYTVYGSHTNSNADH